MAGLLDGWGDFIRTPEGQGLLSAAFGGLAGARKGEPINSLGRAGLAGLGGYSGAQDRAVHLADSTVKRGYMQSQIDENVSQNAARAQTLKTQTEKDAYFMGAPGAGLLSDAPTSPGAYQPSVDGMGLTMPMPAMTAASTASRTATPAAPSLGKFDEWSKQFGIPKDALIADYNANGGKGIADMLYKRGTPNMKVANGFAYDENKLPPGYLPSVSTSTNGQTSMIQIGANGLPVVSAPQGALTTAAAYKGIDTGLGAAAKVNLRKNADGTETPVSELDENPTLQRILSGKPAAAGAPAGYANEPQMKTTVSGAMGASRAEVQREIKQTQADLMKPMDESSKVLLREHLASNQQKLSDPRYTDAKTAPAYGMTNEQATAAKVADVKAVEQVKADVTATDTKLSKFDSASDAIKVIDKALAHPGLSAATGLQGVIDPRNYTPGTDAKNFQVVRDQLRGTAFMSAYASLRGGGQITEIEGAKAEAALVRLDKAQSTEAFKEALSDYKYILNRGLSRAGASLDKEGIRPTTDTAKPATPAPSTPMKGMVRNGFKFKGGDPSSQANWEKQ